MLCDGMIFHCITCTYLLNYFVASLVMIFADLHAIMLYSHSSSLRELLKLLCYFDICY